MKRRLCIFLSFAVAFIVSLCIYLNFFKMSFKTILAFIILSSFLYFCVGAVGKSRKKLKEYEERLTHSTFDKKDYKSVLWNFITLLSPAYLAAFLVSFIPLYSYEVWFAVVFPCVILNCVAFFHTLDEYYWIPFKKTLILAFVIINVLVYILGSLTFSVLF